MSMPLAILNQIIMSCWFFRKRAHMKTATSVSLSVINNTTKYCQLITMNIHVTYHENASFLLNAAIPQMCILILFLR